MFRVRISRACSANPDCGSPHFQQKCKFGDSSEFEVCAIVQGSICLEIEFWGRSSSGFRALGMHHRFDGGMRIEMCL